MNRWLKHAVWMALAGSVTTIAMAQSPPPPPPSAAPSPLGPTVSSGRSYYFECGLVVVMFGGALYAVCKASYRR